MFEPTTKDENYIYRQYLKGIKKGGKVLYTNNSISKFFTLDTPKVDGLGDSHLPFEVVNILLPCKIEKDFEENKIFDEKKLDGYKDVYTVVDLRQRGKKEPNEVKNLKNFQFTLSRKASNIEKSKYNNNNDYKKIEIEKRIDSDAFIAKIEFFFPQKKIKGSEKFDGFWSYNFVEVDKKQLKDLSYILKSTFNDVENYFAFVTKEYYEKLFQKAIEKEIQICLNRNKKYAQKIEYAKARNDQRSINANTNYIAENLKKIKYLKKYYNLQDSEESDNLGKPTIKFEFESNKQLKDFLKENKENLIDSTVEDAEVVEDEPNFKRKSLRGFQDGKPADVFNCSESELVCKGFKPTYKRLTDYSGLIDAADGQNKFCGYGFDKTTLNTLLECCKYYPQVVKLAEHLKADTELQSAFNVWHWLHTNIKYNYDAEGKEEIRTPARVWADRFFGVDCDCLAVFTACLFIGMGYKPAFEIVGFGNKNQYSHIYVNLNGAAVDRVLPVFLQRPSLITKTMIMQIPVYKLSGVDGLNGCELGAVAKLQGLYSSTLSKIYTHTATPEEQLNFRKLKVLLSLQGVDPNGYRLATMIMPHVAAIDEHGAYYFENPELATAAAQYDNELHNLELQNASPEQLNGFFKKVWKGVKKAAKSVGSGVAKAAKATVNSVVNATKATANVVKAGAQVVTGNTKGAKQTIKKAGSQIKSSIVDPLKTTYDVTVDITKNTVINPIVETVKIAGKLFKVIFIKLNPVLVLMRNSLRLLIAVNFLGMATRLNIANYSKDAAIKAGYTEQQWEDAKKAKDRVVRFFTKIGGVKSKIEKSIENGAKKKALFKKDYNKNTKIVETSDTDAQLSGTAPILFGVDGLGEPGTIAAALASVGAFVAKIWGWIKNIVPKAVEWVKENKDKIKNGIDTAKNLLSKNGNSTDNDTATTTTTYYTTTANTNTGAKSNSNNKTLLIAALAVAGIGAAVALSGGGKKRK